MEASRQGNFEFSLKWQSRYAKHVDRFYISRVNLWRDYFPGHFGETIARISVGETLEKAFEPGTIVDPFSRYRIYKIPKRKLNLEQLAEKGVHLQTGRFYPRFFLAGIGFTSGDARPFRVLENDAESVVIDINHPLHSFPLTLTATMIKELPQRFERGGSSNDIAYILSENGPGLQAAPETFETDFLSDKPFERDNDTDDRAFYKTARLVDHIDQTARDQLQSLYSRFLKPDMKILDLMASWNSHLPRQHQGAEITGLGLNEEELEKNPALSHRIRHDLNASPVLPFADKQFDIAVCTVSIEYLINPVAVIKEVARVLKPGAPLIISFSDRWFPPKVTRIWTELHPFERQGLVIDFLRQSEQFEALHTESIRGYPRSAGDPYFKQRHESDPVFAVWGFKAA